MVGTGFSTAPALVVAGEPEGTLCAGVAGAAGVPAPVPAAVAALGPVAGDLDGVPPVVAVAVVADLPRGPGDADAPALRTPPAALTGAGDADTDGDADAEEGVGAGDAVGARPRGVGLPPVAAGAPVGFVGCGDAATVAAAAAALPCRLARWLFTAAVTVLGSSMSPIKAITLDSDMGLP